MQISFRPFKMTLIIADIDRLSRLFYDKRTSVFVDFTDHHDIYHTKSLVWLPQHGMETKTAQKPCC